MKSLMPVHIARTGRLRRRGAMAPLVAVLIIPIFFIVALVIDLGYIAWVNEELQSAADAAALAGTSQLLDRDELKGSPNQSDEIYAARVQAARLAGLNAAGGVYLSLDSNSANDASGETVAAYLANPKDYSSSLQYNTTAAPIAFSPPLLFYVPTVSAPSTVLTPPAVSTLYNTYNSMQIRARRTSARNGALRLFFGGLTGVTDLNMQATATATYEDNIKGFKISRNGPVRAPLLPFAMDVDTFGAIAAGMSVFDLWKYDPTVPPDTTQTPPSYANRVSLADVSASAYLQASVSDTGNPLNPRSLAFNAQASVTVTVAGDRIKEALLVPLVVPGSPNLYVGNWGTIYIGNRTKGSIPALEDQILYGPRESDFNDMGGSMQLGSDGTLAVTGSGIIDSAIRQTLLSIKGQPRVMPLYRPAYQPFPDPAVTGDLSYTIVGFAGIVILEIYEIDGTPAVTDPTTGAVIVPAGPKSLKVFIQPEFVIDATAIGGGSALANPTIGANKTSRFVYRPLAVTR